MDAFINAPDIEHFLCELTLNAPEGANSRFTLHDGQRLAMRWYPTGVTVHVTFIPYLFNPNKFGTVLNEPSFLCEKNIFKYFSVG